MLDGGFKNKFIFVLFERYGFSVIDFVEVKLSIP